MNNNAALNKMAGNTGTPKSDNWCLNKLASGGGGGSTSPGGSTSVGTFADLAALQAAIPTPADHKTALVGTKAPYDQYYSKAGAWVKGGSSGGAVSTVDFATDAEIAAGTVTHKAIDPKGLKVVTDLANAKLGKITLTNPINLDVVHDNIEAVTNRVTALGLAPDAQAKLTQSTNQLQVPKQTIPGKPADIAKDNRLITVANAYEIEAALKQYADGAFQTKADMGAIHTYVAGSTMVKKMMEMKDQLDKVTHATSTKPADIVTVGTIPVDGEAGGFVMGYPDLFLQNPANPGHDIKDGKEYYVTFTKKDHDSTSTSWIWLTEAGKTKRLWTNDAKTTAVDGLSMGVYIKKGAKVKIVKKADEWYVKDVIIPALPQGTTKALLNDGSIKMEASYVPKDDNDIVTMKTIREFRTTITHNIADHAKPTLAECKATFKLLPHFDWTKDDDYYIKDSTGGKIVLIKYRSTPAATEAAPGNFFYEVLSKAV